MKQQSLYAFRGWFFELLIDYFIESGWVIVIKDFPNSRVKKERNYWGLTNYKKKIIYLDKIGGNVSVLVHELCHFGLRVMLDKISEKVEWKELKKIKGRLRANKEYEWRELRTLEFEKYFYRSLSRKQKKILQGFIDEAMERFIRDNG